MGDKGGKKDKEKNKQQQLTKQKQEEQKKQEKTRPKLRSRKRTEPTGACSAITLKSPRRCSSSRAAAVHAIPRALQVHLRATECSVCHAGQLGRIAKSSLARMGGGGWS